MFISLGCVFTHWVMGMFGYNHYTAKAFLSLAFSIMRLGKYINLVEYCNINRAGQIVVTSTHKGKDEMTYTFNGFVLNLESFSLLKNGKNIALKPLVFELIVYLVTNRERLITRDELLEKLWGGREVADATLSNHIKEARYLLGDSGSTQQIIRTVHGRGYQFIAKLDAITAIESDALRPVPKKTYFKILFRLTGLSVIIYFLVQNYFQQNLMEAVNRISKYQKASFTTFQIQAKRRDELVEMITSRLKIKRELQFEKFFAHYFEQMNKKEKFVFAQIRAMTETGLFENNKKVVEELTSHPEILNKIKKTSTLLLHLKFWLNKYHSVFKKRKDMCVLYVGVEDGFPYPSGVDQIIQKWLSVHK